MTHTSDDATIQITKIAATEVDRFIPLFQEVWPGGGALHGDRARWFFGASNPNGRAPVLAAEAEGRLVGARGSTWWPLRVGATTLKTVQLHGTCVASDFRRRGIFSRLNVALIDALAGERADAIFNVSVAASRAGYEKLGWRYLPGLRRLILCPRPLKLLAAIRGDLRKLRGGFTPIDEASEAPPAEGWGALLETRGRHMSGLAHTAYDAPFLRWRYSNPSAGYRFLSARGLGVVVYRRGTRAGQRELLIGDIFPTKHALQVAPLIALLLLRERPVLLSTTMTTDHPYRGVLRRCGFFPDPKGDLNLGWRPLSEDAVLAMPSLRWALQTADVDTF